VPNTTQTQALSGYASGSPLCPILKTGHFIVIRIKKIKEISL